MPDIDSLSIQITSSTQGATQSINALIRNLGNLNAALNNYTADSQYIKGFNSLIAGLNGISSAVKSIDVEKIKDLSRVLGSLGTSGEKISKLNFVKSFSNMGAELAKFSTEARTMAKDFAKNFDIPEKEMVNLTRSIQKMHEATSESSFTQAQKEVEELALKYKKLDGFAKDVANSEKELRAELSKTKIYLSSDVMSNMGDNAKSVRGKIGIQNTTSNINNGSDIVTAAREMGVYVDTSYEAVDALKELATSEADAIHNAETIYNVSGYFEDLKNKVLDTASAAKSLDDEFMAVPDFDPFGDDIPVEANTALNAIQNVSQSMENLHSEMTAEIGNPFEGLVNGLESLKGIEIPAEKFAGVATLASSLGKFGGKNAQTAITTIPAVGKAFAQMASELSKAPTISDNLVKMAEALSKYSKSAKTATTSTNNFSNSTNVLKTALTHMQVPTLKAHKGFTSLASIFGRLYANFFLLIRAARMLGNAMDYSSSMTEAQNVVSVVFGKQSDVMDKFAQTAIKDFGLARLSAVQFASRFQAMGSTMGITAEQVVKENDYIAGKITGNARAYQDLGNSVADMSINLTKLTADIASLYNQDYDEVAQDMQAVYTGMTRPLRKYGLDLTQATLKEWAMANGLDANIEKMTQAEKTMLRYQYVMSRAAGAMGDFQKTQDTWANSLRTVKQLLQEVARTIGEALINALRPALLAFKNFLFNFLQLTESALNALGKLLGWKQINFGGASLVEDTEDYADALDDAAGAAKKLKGQLRGIDELNNLTTNKGSGGGAGGTSGLGADIESIWDMIQDTEDDYISSVKDWYDFGRKISNAFKEGLESINWQDVFEKATGFGKHLAEFLNGLIDPETWRLFGSTIGNGIMTAFKFAFAFGDEFDWENLGTAISEAINGFFEAIDGGEMADTIDVFVQGLSTTLKTALKKIKWDEIFKDLLDFLSHIDIETLDITIKAIGTITGLGLLGAGIVSLLKINPIALPLTVFTISAGLGAGAWISSQFEKALGVDEASGEANWTLAWEGVFDSISTTYGEVLGEQEKIDPVGDLLGAKDGGLGRNVNKKGIHLFWENLFGGYDKANFAFNFGKWNLDNIFKPFQIGRLDESPIASLDKMLQNMWNDVSPSLEKFRENWQEFWFTVFDFYNMENGGPLEALGVFDWLDEKSENFLGWITTLAAKFGSFIGDADIENITAKIGSLVSNITLFGDGANVSGIDNVASAFGLLSDKEGEADGALSTLMTKFDEFKTNTAELMQKWWDEDIAPKFDLPTWEEMVSSIKTSIETVWNDTVSFWSEAVPQWWNENVAPWFTKEKWVETLTGIKDAFQQIWGDAKELAKGFFNSMADFVENFINGAIDGFAALANAKSLLSEVKIDFNIPHINIPRFASGGYPDTGSLFWAGEAGAEMVGSINGKTAVASNGEITGIISAIQQTSGEEIGLLRQQNTLLQGILDKEFGISNDDLFRSVRNSARNFTNRTGNPAF